MLKACCTVFRIRIQGPFWSGIRGLKKGQKFEIINNHNIIFLFSDFYNILSFNCLRLMRNLIIIKLFNFFQIVLRNSLDLDSRFSGSGSKFRFLAGSGFNWIRNRNTGLTWQLAGRERAPPEPPRPVQRVRGGPPVYPGTAGHHHHCSSTASVPAAAWPLRATDLQVTQQACFFINNGT